MHGGEFDRCGIEEDNDDGGVVVKTAGQLGEPEQNSWPGTVQHSLPRG